MTTPKVTWPNNLRDIPISEMKPGQTALIINEDYSGLIVRCYSDGSIRSVCNDTCWKGSLLDDLDVRILPPGTIIEFTVE